MKKKKYTLKSLVGMALQYQTSDKYDEQYWKAVSPLHFWGTPEIVSLGQKLYQSHHWRKRMLAVNIFSQLLSKDKTGGHAHTPYAVEESQALLYKALDDEQSEVVSCAISGLGHRPMPSATLRLVSFTDHNSKSIRYSLAFALGNYDDEASIDALLKLATDKDDDVRDWATFALGSMHTTVDSPAIRDILWRNVFDENLDVSGEALKGLAERKDLRVVDVLKERLAPDCWGYELSAAEMIADSSLYPYLENIKQSIEDEYSGSYWMSRVVDAMEACKPKE